MTTAAMEETSVAKVALVVVDMVAVGMARVDLVMMEATLKMAEATVILATTTINLQILDPGQEETLEAKALALVVVEAHALPNHETQVTVAVPAASAAVAAKALAEVLFAAKKQR